MTILAAAIGPDGTWLGADGLSTDPDGGRTSTGYRKWNISPDRLWAFASAGEVTFDAVVLEEIGDLWPKKLEDVEHERKKFAQRIRERILAVKGVECVRDKDSIFGDFRLSPLVVTPGHAWRLCSDLRSFGEPFEGVFQTGGAGAEYATGAMSVLLASGVTSAERLVKAGVETACRSSVYCGGEMFFERLAGRTQKEGRR